MKPKLQKLQKTGEGTSQALVQFALFAVTKPGFKYISQLAKRYLGKLGVFKEKKYNYDHWIKERENIDTVGRNFLKTIGDLQYQPSFVTIVVSRKEATETLKGMVQQVYPSVAIHLVGVASNGNYASDQPVSKKHDDSPIHFHGCTETQVNDVVAEIVALPGAEYILFLAPDTQPAPDLLFECVRLLNKRPETDIIYTDGDTITEDGRFVEPYFKPDWSPDTLLSRNYIGTSFVIRKQLFEHLNGFRLANKVAAFDLLLRASELTQNIAHLAHPLLHVKNETDQPSGVDTALMKEVISKALARRNTPGAVVEIPGANGCFEIQYAIKKVERVSIIIPTKDQAGLLKIALDSILNKTEYTDYEIIVLNNNSITIEFFELVKAYIARHPSIFRVIDAAFPFNFSKLINLGAAASTGQYLLLLNNDIEVKEGTWLTKMLGYAQHEHIGAVGVKLAYPDDTIQHAGIVAGIGEATAHVLAREKRESVGYFNNLKAATNYSALTAACMMVNREKFVEVGAMDESLPVEYNDIDLCLKLFEGGYYNVFLPQVELYHHESATRGHPFRSIKSWQQHDADLKVFLKKWQYIVDSDPFYNTNLTRSATDFSWKGQ